MKIALATGWTPDVVSELTFSQIAALGRQFKERAKLMKAR
jgi:hypothetical protein